MDHSKQEYKQTDIGLIPVDWEVKKLGDCLIRNPEYGINAASSDYSDTLPTYLRITDISISGHFIPVNKVSVNHPNSSNYYLEKGDLVFARTGASVGKTYLYNESDGALVFAGFLIRVKPNQDKLNSNLLKYLTDTKFYWDWVKLMSMRSGQPGINGNEYRQYKIPLSPLKPL
jgi:type I restriction enzyme, S subunit